MPRAGAVIGVDVGGTTTAAGLVGAAGAVLVSVQEPTHGRGPGRTLDAVIDLVERLRGEAARRSLRVLGIGVGVPGSVDAATGTVGGDAHYVPDLAHVPVAAAIRARSGLPVFVDNDVNVLALGEWMYGAGRGARSLVVLALGTGVGGGVILDGALQRGHGGFGGELGHVPVKFDGRPCVCGGRGCLKAYVSGTDIAAQGSARLGRAASAEEVFRLARAGDARAGAVVDEVIAALGAGLAVIVNGWNPERLLLAGSVAKSLAPLEGRLRESVRRHAFARALASTRIVILARDKDSTVRGGAALFRYEARRRRARRRSAR